MILEWKPFSAVTTALLAIVAGLLLQAHHRTELSIARANTSRAVAIATVAVDVAREALHAADSLRAVADSQTQLAEANAQQATMAQRCVVSHNCALQLSAWLSKRPCAPRSPGTAWCSWPAAA